MKKVLLALSSVVFSFFLCVISQAYAQEEGSSATTGTTDWKQELSSDKQQIRDQKQEINQNAQAARAQEEQLRGQIKDAIAAGDMATADQLKEQLRAVHQENVQQKQQDMQNMRSDRNELRGDVKEARQEGLVNPPGPVGGPGAGPVNRNNPPGPMGGPGTNWGNPPGPRGGAGASPARSGAPAPRAARGARAGGNAPN